MAEAGTIEVAVRKADGGVSIIDLSGFLDASTVARLDEEIRRLIAGGDTRILINFSGLHYISSSGVGVFMGSLTEIRAQHGELKLASMPPKVRKVFDLLGFAELVPIFETEAQALSEFRSVSAAAEEETAFPVQVACSGCRTQYSAAKVGMYRCRKCNEIFFVDSRAGVSVIRKGGEISASAAKRVEMKVPADVNYLQHLRRLVTGLAAEEGFDEDKVNQIEMAFDEAITNVIEHAYNFDSTQAIDVTVQVDADKFVVTLHDRGRVFQPSQVPLPDLRRHIAERKTGGLGRYLMKTLMDDVAYRTAPDGRNELTLTKFFRPRDA